MIAVFDVYVGHRESSSSRYCRANKTKKTAEDQPTYVRNATFPQRMSLFLDMYLSTWVQGSFFMLLLQTIQLFPALAEEPTKLRGILETGALLCQGGCYPC